MWTLSASHRFERIVNKSRFLAIATRTEERAAALAFIEGLEDVSASHHCYAWRLGADYRFNDDGEPGGTAGQPILRAIDGQGLDQVVVLVIRWFGGVKLGAGGLARAYGGTAAECLRTAPRIELKPMATLRIDLPFECVAGAYRVLEGFGATRSDESYHENGLTLTVSLEASQRRPLESELRDATRGRARVTAPG